ncbi:hypothetical protein V6N13_000426 [Hibiscus sabdariffa]
MVVEGFQPDEVTLGILNQAVSTGSVKKFIKAAEVLEWCPLLLEYDFVFNEVTMMNRDWIGLKLLKHGY